MTRAGLTIACVVAIVVGVIFGVHARFDLDLAGLFFNPAKHLFVANVQIWVQDLRAGSRWLVALIVAPAFIAIIGKLLLPRRRMLIDGRAALFLVLTLALGPGILANEILKDHWGRVRPIDVTEFGGVGRFTPWWDPRGQCPTNCSFVAGEPSGAFWTLAPAALAPPQWQLLAFAGAVLFGAGNGLLRIAGGAHFFTDVVFAGVFMYFLAWVLHGLIFRWRATRLNEETVDHALAWLGTAVRAWLHALALRIGKATGKRS